MAARLPRLIDLNPLFRLGLSVLIVTLIGGYVVSGIHLKNHHENRDGRPGLTLTDIMGAYHGVVSPAPMLDAIRRGHPEGMPEADRTALIAWLTGDRVQEDYDNFDLGDAMPEDLIAVNCASCHARDATVEGAYPELPLEYPDDVFAVAISQEIVPNSQEIKAASLHAHAPSMSLVLIVIAGLAVLTRLPAGLVGGIVAVSAVGLLADSVGQWVSAGYAEAVYAIVVGGFAYTGGVSLLGVLVILDCWYPRAPAPAGSA